MTDNEVAEKAKARIDMLVDRKFFGRLTLSFRAGNIYQAVEERSLKFDQQKNCERSNTNEHHKED